MSRCRVVFLGSRPLGATVLAWLMTRQDVELIGMVVRESTTPPIWGTDPADCDAVPRIHSLEALSTIAFDLGVSVNYWQPIPPALLAKPTLGFVNLHHSYNLRLRGRGTCSAAILRARQDHIWHHGTTLHWMREEIDAGPILASTSVPVTEFSTAQSLFDAVEDAAVDVITTWLPRVWTSRIIPYDPPTECVWHPAHLYKLKEIDLRYDPLTIYDRVRAFWCPPYEGPYVLDRGRKRYVTTLAEHGSDLLVDAGEGRCVWACR